MVANDSKRIWQAAEFFHAHMYATKRRTAPNNADQRIVAQYSIASHVTRGLRTHNADLSEQAWEQRAAERLPRTRHNYQAAIQHDLFEQFPARYSLREGEMGSKCPVCTAFDITEATIEECSATCPLLCDCRLNLQERPTN